MCLVIYYYKSIILYLYKFEWFEYYYKFILYSGGVVIYSLIFIGLWGIKWFSIKFGRKKIYNWGVLNRYVRLLLV